MQIQVMSLNQKELTFEFFTAIMTQKIKTETGPPKVKKLVLSAVN